MDSILPPWPCFSDEETQIVGNILASNKVNYWTGQIGREFEKEFAAWSDSKHAIAVTNGTLALDLALQGLGIGSHNGGSAKDEVIVTPRSFIASVSSVINAGAVPIFADVDIQSGNISPATIAPKINDATSAIIAVHLAGWPCDIKAIMALAKDNGLKVIEDCAQAHGCKVDGQSVGSFGDVSAWSFCQDKIMTTGGEGGMVTTNDSELWNKMWSYKDHGKSWDAVYNRKHPPGFRWLHESIGTNWRMLEMQAGIGRYQLKQMDHWTKRRGEIAQYLQNMLMPFSKAIISPKPADNITHAHYRLYAYVKEEGLKDGWSRDRIVAEANAIGAPLFQGSCSEIYLEKAFDDSISRPTQRLPNAKRLGETSLMFLTHPNINDDQLGQYGTRLKTIFEQAVV